MKTGLSVLSGVLLCVSLAGAVVRAQETPGAVSGVREYENRLVRIEQPRPLLADYPEFFEPIIEQAHYEAPAIVQDAGADLSVRAWRFS
ncbi:MAG: hypothetical protein ACK5KS_26520, partial [Planctomyces sp.]